MQVASSSVRSSEEVSQRLLSRLTKLTSELQTQYSRLLGLKAIHAIVLGSQLAVLSHTSTPDRNTAHSQLPQSASGQPAGAAGAGDSAEEVAEPILAGRGSEVLRLALRKGESSVHTEPAQSASTSNEKKGTEQAHASSQQAAGGLQGSDAVRAPSMGAASGGATTLEPAVSAGWASEVSAAEASALPLDGQRDCSSPDPDDISIAEHEVKVDCTLCHICLA